MMKITHLPVNLNYLEVLLKRSKSDVGAMIDALFHNFTEGKTENFADGGMEVLYQLFDADLNSFRAAKKKQSDTNSSNAKGRSAKGKSKNKKPKSDAIASQQDDSAEADDESDCNEDSGDNELSEESEVATTDDDYASKADSVKPPEVASETNDTANVQLSFDFANETSDRSETEQNATVTPDSAKDNAVPTFEKVRDVYNKTGGNENQALTKWQQLSDDEKIKAFAYAESIVGKRDNRTYLYVFLRDKEWTKKAAK